MAYDSWGESPLYENEDLKEGSIPTVTPIEQVRDEGNCGEVTNRGEEACECVGKLTKNRRQPHSRQICEATDRNPIQGRCGQASEPIITKPSAFLRIGKSGACAEKAIRLIQGDPPHVSVIQACLQAEPTSDMAIKHAISRKSYWRLSRTPALRYAMPNKWLEQLGLLSLKQLWCDLAPLRGTA